MATITKTIPTLPEADVASHNTKESCYVTLGAKVYDITPFLEDHPGGGDLIVDYAGKDVRDIMGDEISHFHSDAAYEILDDHFVGYVASKPIVDAATESNHPEEIVPLPATGAGAEDLKMSLTGEKAIYAATGMSTAEDLSKDTDSRADYRAHKFLDLDSALLPQVWNGGFSKDFYLEQVHRPRHYKGGQSAPLFGNFLEPLSKTPWWVVPTVWVPPVIYGTALSGLGLGSVPVTMAYWLTGLAIWTFVEYGMHRGLFHVDEYAHSPLTYKPLLTHPPATSPTTASS